MSEKPEGGLDTPNGRRQMLSYLPLLVIAFIVIVMIVISRNDHSVSVAALPTQPSTGTELLVTGTVPPEATATIEPPTPITSEPSPVPTSTPTAYPATGRHFVLRYDDNTLFMRNDSADHVDISQFAFERLDASGNPLNHVDGSRWAKLYRYMSPQGCIKIMFWDKISNLSPPSCRIINSEAREHSGSNLDFWTPQQGGPQFRILYDGQEIGRCEISAGECEVFAP